MDPVGRRLGGWLRIGEGMEGTHRRRIQRRHFPAHRLHLAAAQEGRRRPCWVAASGSGRPLTAARSEIVGVRTHW